MNNLWKCVFHLIKCCPKEKKTQIRKTIVDNIQSALQTCNLFYSWDSWALFSNSPFMLIPDESAGKLPWDRVLHGNASDVQLITSWIWVGSKSPFLLIWFRINSFDFWEHWKLLLLFYSFISPFNVSFPVMLF